MSGWPGLRSRAPPVQVPSRCTMKAVLVSAAFKPLRWRLMRPSATLWPGRSYSQLLCSERATSSCHGPPLPTLSAAPLVRSKRLTLHCPLRHYSSDPVTNGNPYAVIRAAEDFLQFLHSHTHLPWWAVIVLATVLLRSLVTLPLAIHQNKMLVKMELLLPTLKEYQEAVKHNVIAKCRRANLPVEEANRRMKKEARRVGLQLYAQEGCSPYKVSILPWVQLPLWLLLSLALRNMSGAFPGAAPSPEVTLSMASEGALWIQDLTLPDPFFILPFLLASTNLLNIEMHALKRMSPSRTQRVMTNTFRTLSFAMGFISSQLPAAMTLYWAVSSSYGLAQNVSFKLPKVRRRLGIPKTASESKQPFRELAAIVEEKAKNFLTRQREGSGQR